MGIFSWFKKKNSEVIKNEIYIEGNYLFYHDHGNLEMVHLDQLKYAYVQILGERPFLFLFDYQQRYILATQSGFMEVYLKLSKRFGFDDVLFRKIVKENIEDSKERIWIKPEKRNYNILEGNYDDLGEGFEVLSNPPKFLSWDTTYAEIFNHNIGEFYNESFGLRYFRFNYPVRIGSLHIDNLEFYADNVREDMAIEGYFADLCHETQTDKSYHEIRTYLKIVTDTSEEDLRGQGHERIDQKYLYFYKKNIGFSICYTYDSEIGYDDGSTSFTITNYRNYDTLLRNEAYDDCIELTKIVELAELFELNVDYKKNNNVKSIPTLVKENYSEKSIIWLDKKNDKIGFSGEDVALIYNVGDINLIVIQNVLPAKGAGYSYLEIVLNNNKKVVVYYAEQNVFDDVINNITTELELKVQVAEPFYNC